MPNFNGQGKVKVLEVKFMFSSVCPILKSCAPVTHNIRNFDTQYYVTRGNFYPFTELSVETNLKSED